MAEETKVQAFVWNEHEEPLEIATRMDFNLLQHDLMHGLDTKEYGKLVRTYPKTEHVPGGELVLHYRAFTDEHRGRIIVSGTDLAELDASYRKTKKYCAQKVFTPTELYALKPTRTDYGSWHAVSVHLRDEIGNGFDLDLDAVEKTQRMETRTLVDHDYDGRRGWTLQTVWFDNKPVMVVNSAGRDGDEYHERWITDPELFGELVTFLKSFMSEDTTGFVKADAKIPAMTEFYNHTIHDYYDVEAQEPKKQ